MPSNLETLIKELEKRLNEPDNVETIVQDVTDVFFGLVGLNYDKIEEDFIREYKGCDKPNCVYCKLRKKWLIRYLQHVKKWLVPAKQESLALLKQANDVAIAVAKMNPKNPNPHHHN